MMPDSRLSTPSFVCSIAVTKPEQTPAEPEDTAIEIHIAGQKDGSAE